MAGWTIQRNAAGEPIALWNLGPRKTEPVRLSGFTEICASGMFTRTLQENPDTVMLRDHVGSQLLGGTKAGTLTLTQDSRGSAQRIVSTFALMSNDIWVCLLLVVQLLVVASSCRLVSIPLSTQL